MSTIRRAAHDDVNPWFQLARTTAQDRSLTFEARGLLIYLLSKPGDWKVQVKDLEQECGKTRVYRILKELIAANYMQKEFIRINGKIAGIDYLVYETPALFPEKLETENQQLTYTDNKLPDSDSITSVTDSENLQLSDKSDKVVQSKKNRDVKKESRRNWTLEVIALECFSLQRNQIKQASGRIAGIVNGFHSGDGEKGLLQYEYGVEKANHKTITEEQDLKLSQELILMFAWWRKTKPGISVPKVAYKIWSALQDYRKAHQPHATTITPLGNGATLRDGIAYDATGKIIPPVAPPRLPPIVTKKEPEYDF